MKKILMSAILMLTVVLPGVLTAENPLYGFDMSVNGKYIWRGMTYNSEATLWSDLWVYWKGFTGTIWGSMDLTDVKKEQWKWTDIFFFFDYSRTFGRWNCSVGYAHYIFPGYDDFFPTTGEIYGKAGTDFGVFQASLAAYFDINEVNGLYIMPELSRSFSIDKVTSTLSVSLGFAESKHNLYYYYSDKSGFTDLTVKLGFSYSPKGSLGNYMSFTGNLNYATILDSELAEAYENRSNFWVGIGISLFFGGE